jgi:CDI immunity proteins
LEDAAVKGGFDRRKSLQELEQDDWGEPTYDSYLVTTCHRLRRKPLAEFAVEDLRIMIGQKISLSYLVPLAVERLEEEPLAAGDYYAGDLLQAVLSAGEEFWASHPDSLQRVRKVVGRVKDLLRSLDEIERPTILKLLAEAPRSMTG